jgi:hypothetical protein
MESDREEEEVNEGLKKVKIKRATALQKELVIENDEIPNLYLSSSVITLT